MPGTVGVPGPFGPTRRAPRATIRLLPGPRDRPRTPGRHSRGPCTHSSPNRSETRRTSTRGRRRDDRSCSRPARLSGAGRSDRLSPPQRPRARGRGRARSLRSGLSRPPPTPIRSRQEPRRHRGRASLLVALAPIGRPRSHPYPTRPGANVSPRWAGVAPDRTGAALATTTGRATSSGSSGISTTRSSAASPRSNPGGRDAFECLVRPWLCTRPPKKG
jgi:hypothetical protein